MSAVKGWGSLMLAWAGCCLALPGAGAEDAATQIQRGEQALAEGRPDAALAELDQALAQARQRDNPRLQAAAAGAMGVALAHRGDTAAARRQLEQAISASASCPCADIAASSHNNLGNLLSETGDPGTALAHFRQGLALVQGPHLAGLALKLTINAARAALATGQEREAEQFMAQAEVAVAALPASLESMQALLSLGLLRQAEVGAGPMAAHRLFRQALETAGNLGDARGQSLALGYLAGLYTEEGRGSEALRLLREALLAAQRGHATDLEYRWHWQSGRQLHAQGRVEEAISAYRSAVGALQAVAPDLLGTSGHFRTQVKPIFLELVALLFERSEQLPPQTGTSVLHEARQVIEGYRAAELQDYFADSCVADARAGAQALEGLAPRTVVLYPILFPDRVELLVSSERGMRRATSRVAADTLAGEVEALRTGLQRLKGLDYLGPSRRLHDWLIRPVAGWLAEEKADTLVVVPDGPLRNLPFAALHDGEGFLVRRHAVVTAPGLALTDVRPFRERRGAALLAGLTEPVQGFPALPEVTEELDAIAAHYPGKRLQDADFVEANLRQALATQPYSLLHVATHARFERDARDSFLLTYDGRMSLTGLESLLATTRGRDGQVELLGLSACETARGDDRAALGLAGVAVKAGTRSAVATLWRVSDEATAVLLPDFYRRLADTAVAGKAQALRLAQLKLMKDWRFRHPGYWAPFLLIGNWL